MGLPDVVYLVREGDDNDELRYSLRSLVNLPHRSVWLAGYQPSWTANVGRIEVVQHPGRKWENQESNLKAACTHPDVADTFVVFNDDFFVMEPIGTVPALHRGPFTRVLPTFDGRNSRWIKRMRATAKLLGADALCYDSLHVPLPVDKQQLAGILDSMPDGVLFRSVYGNRAGLGGDRHPDVKVKRGRERVDGPFLSTSDSSFRRMPAGKQIRAAFPDPSPYEQ